jgi:hypothetical protein
METWTISILQNMSIYIIPVTLSYCHEEGYIPKHTSGAFQRICSIDFTTREKHRLFTVSEELLHTKPLEDQELPWEPSYVRYSFISRASQSCVHFYIGKELARRRIMPMLHHASVYLGHLLPPRADDDAE